MIRRRRHFRDPVALVTAVCRGRVCEQAFSCVVVIS